MNKPHKFLSRLSLKDRKTVLQCLGLIQARKFTNLDFKKLKGVGNLYRIRRKDIRIIFYMDSKEVRIIRLDRRSGSTYKDL